MKYLSKYKIFELTTNKILDLVIDKDGVLHDTHGYIDSPKSKKGKITDNRNVEYVAGIDKNGKLFTFEIVDKSGNIIINGLPLIDPDNGENWNINVDYIEYTSKEGTGWVNIKIDMEVIRKVKRYASAIHSGNSKTAFGEKLKSLSNTKDLIKNCSTTEAIQRQMAAIMLLRYLSEIKDYFNPSSSGFLLESFLGGLIPGKVPDDNSEFDVIGDDGSTYQIKFYDWNAGSINFNKNKDCDYYVIALKKPDSVVIWILTNTEFSKASKIKNTLWVGDYLVTNNSRIKKSKSVTKKKVNGTISVSKLKKIENLSFKLDLSNINDRIDEISISLREVIGELWTEISDLQYNCETIITGVDKDHKVIEEEQCETLYTHAKNNITKLGTLLDRLKVSMSGRRI